MSANKFALKHHQVDVEYPIGLTLGAPAPIYEDGSSAAVNFTSAEITTDETALGSLVSVPLVRTVETGRERFGSFLLPICPPGGEALRHIKTEALVAEPFRVPSRPSRLRGGAALHPSHPRR